MEEDLDVVTELVMAGISSSVVYDVIAAVGVGTLPSFRAYHNGLVDSVHAE